ncbi:DUF3114 domain-containing protein [Enterococcus hirae]|nr:DUF3114 domain-containing protein [Enterococcus hirae]
MKMSDCLSSKKRELLRAANDGIMLLLAESSPLIQASQGPDTFLGWRPFEAADFEEPATVAAFSEFLAPAASFRSLLRKTASEAAGTLLERLCTTITHSLTLLQKDVFDAKAAEQITEELAEFPLIFAALASAALMPWEEPVRAYWIHLLYRKLEKTSGTTRRETLKNLLAQTAIVGTPVMTRLFNNQMACFPWTQKNARRLLAVVFQLLGATLNEKGDLQLEKHFWRRLSPLDPFLRYFSAAVQRAFPAGLHEISPLARQTHQLRYYLDEALVTFIRQSYPLCATDRERLLRYDAECKMQGLSPSTAEPARLHNKIKQGRAVSHGWNYKRVYYFHAEFILNQAGEFLFMDLRHPAENRLEAIINTSSFNYADQNDHLHRLLDYHYDPKGAADPERKDPTLRKQALRGCRAPAFDSKKERQNRWRYQRAVKRMTRKLKRLESGRAFLGIR